MNIDPILGLNLRPPVKFVFTVLAFRAYEDDREAHMTNGKLMEQTGLSRRAVQGAVQELEEVGLITVRRGWGKGAYNIYIINMKKVQEMHPMSDVKVQDVHPPTGGKDATDAPLEEKNVTTSKGASNAPKGAPIVRKGAGDAVKGAAGAPNKTKKTKYKTARPYARGKMPPRSGPSGPVAKKEKREPAVNRAAKGTGGVMPQFHETTSIEARKTWRDCLQGRTFDFCIPESALLGPIEGGRAIIFNLTGFERDQIEQSDGKYTLQSLISRKTNQTTDIILSGASA